MEPFFAQIMAFGGNFAIRGWATCDGQLLAINSNTALFSLVGTTYGGDGRTTFGLPDLRGRSIRGRGTGPGLSNVREGQKGGTETVTLNTIHLPSHNHNVSVKGSSTNGDSDTPTTTVALAKGNAATGLSNTAANIYTTGTADVAISVNQANIGNNQSFSVLNPYLGMYYLIALQGVFPSRS